jgi:hypothetical protein
MPQGAYLTPQIEALIAAIYLQQHDIGPKKAREELLEQMRNLGLDKNFGPDWPHVSTVSKHLKKCREENDKRSPESKKSDEFWSIASLTEYPIEREALPIIIKLCFYRYTKYFDRLTIREAKWASWLSAWHKPDSGEDEASFMEWLSLASFAYAFNERISQTVESSFISSEGADIVFFMTEDKKWCPFAQEGFRFDKWLDWLQGQKPEATAEAEVLIKRRDEVLAELKALIEYHYKIMVQGEKNEGTHNQEG